MKTKEESENLRDLVEEIEQAKKSDEIEHAVSEFISDPDNIPIESRKDLISNFVEDVTYGADEYSKKDELKDALRDEIIDELRDQEDHTIKPNWVPIATSAATQAAEQTVLALNSLLDVIQQSNSLGYENDLISSVKKAQLIAVLKAAIAELEGPIVDRGRLQGVFDWLAVLIRKQADKEVGGAMNTGLKHAKEKLGELIGNIPSDGPPTAF